MARSMNPFKATLGATPPLLVGREDSIENFAVALEEGPGTHERISLVVGPRGIGKTVLLNEFEKDARNRGWLVLSETATSGFVERLRASLIRELSQEKTSLESINLTILGIGGGVNWRKHAPRENIYTLRNALEDYLTYKGELDRKAKQEPTGVLITLDEMHHRRGDEVIEFGATIQHLVREGREIAVVMAGIPSSIKPLLSATISGQGSNPVTFLRRAERINLAAVKDEDVKQALEEPLVGSGVSWDKKALAEAVAACHGYPFMIQLVGQWAFRLREENVITESAAKAGIEKAQAKLGHLVHEPALDDLSDMDKSFLVYMAQDDGPSSISDIKNRLGRSGSYVSNYRRRLIDAEMIVEAGRARVDFALPYLRDFLREHATALVVDSDANNPR